MKNILMVVGSLREKSFNRMLADEIKEMIKDKAEVNFLEYADLPFLSQDHFLPVPERVADVRQKVLQADGLWILSPEFNYAIPGVLKNLLDWLSCPADPSDRKSSSVLKSKKVSISSVAGRSAGLGVRKQLAELLEIMSMKLIGGIGSGVVLDGQAFSSGILSLSELDREIVKKQAEEFLAAI